MVYLHSQYRYMLFVSGILQAAVGVQAQIMQVPIGDKAQSVQAGPGMHVTPEMQMLNQQRRLSGSLTGNGTVSSGVYIEAPKVNSRSRRDQQVSQADPNQPGTVGGLPSTPPAPQNKTPSRPLKY